MTNQEIETFGKYQLGIYALITLPLILSASFTLDYVFTAGHVDYRCLVPECESANNTQFTGLPWLNYSVPVDAECRRYKVQELHQQAIQGNRCTKESFTEDTVECEEWIYDPEEVTIMTEWKIACTKNMWRRTIIGTMNNLGQLVGLSFASTLSDKYGRRNILTLITFLSGISGLIHSFSINYWMFFVFEFLDAFFAAGMYSACFIYAMEMTGTEKRVMGSVIISCLYAVGEMWLGLAAMWVKHWRILMRVVYGPGVLVIFLRYVLPESVRWLRVNGKSDEAVMVYRKMAKVNNVKLSEDAFSELKIMNGDQKEKISMEPENEEKLKATKAEESSVLQVGKSPQILLRLLICSFCWLTNTFVYYGLSVNSTETEENKYIKYILVAAVEIPANILVYPFVNNFGRKLTLCGSFIVSGFCCLAAQFLGPELGSLFTTLLYICGKGAITMAFSTSYVYTTELFPTTLRHSLLGICSMTGRIGSILAPQTPLLDKFVKGLSMVLFGGMSLAAGMLSLTFPETLGNKLPDTIAEAENIGKTKNIDRDAFASNGGIQ